MKAGDTGFSVNSSLAYISLVVVVTWPIGNEEKYVQVSLEGQSHNLGGVWRNAPPETFGNHIANPF